MKSRFNIKEIKMTVPGKVMGTEKDTEIVFGGMEIETEYTLEDAIGLWRLQKEILKESPELIAEFTDKFAEKFTAMAEKYDEPDIIKMYTEESVG